MSQWELAVALGVTNGAISQWETGRTKPRRSSAQRLDDMLGADGEILAAYGFAGGVSQAEELAQLQERVEQLERAVTTLAGQVLDDLETRGAENDAVRIVSEGPAAWRSDEPLAE